MLGADVSLTAVQHVPECPPGRIAPWAIDQGLGLQRVRAWMDDERPAVDETDAIVLLGGPLDPPRGPQHEGFADERAWIRQAVDAGVPVLGVGMGAQMLAVALGGSVEPMEEPEVGVFETAPTSAGSEHELSWVWPDTFEPLHWHSTRFEPPDQAVTLAESQACEKQAFAIGEQVLGLQFHVELEPEDVGRLRAASGGLPEGRWVRAEDEITKRLGEAQNLDTALETTLEAWAPEPA
jgi:GMP synthase-like glutamine amidotransferase